MRSVLLVAGAVLIPAVTMALSFIIYPLLVVSWSGEFGVSRSALMGVMAASGMGLSLATPVVGWLTERHSPRTVAAAGAGVLSLGLALASRSHSFTQIALAYVLMIGAGAALVGPLPAKTTVVRRFPNHAGALSGAMGLGSAVIATLAPVPAAAAILAFGWRPVLLGAALLIAALVAPFAWMVFDGPKDELRTVGAPASRGPVAKGGILVELRTPSFWLIVASILPFIAVLAAISPNIVLIASDAGIKLQQASILVSLTSGGTALGALALGALADRVDLRKLYLALAVVVSASLLLMLGQSNILVLALALTLLGLGTGGVLTLDSILVLRHFGRAVFPRVTGMLTLCLVPTSMSAALAAWIRDVRGDYDLVFVGAAILLIPGLLAMWRLEQPNARPMDNDIAPVGTPACDTIGSSEGAAT